MQGSFLPEPFPSIINKNVKDNENLNPGIRLFGRRFFKGQTEIELMSEFFSVLFSKKWIGEKEINTYLPSLKTIEEWNRSSVKLFYQPPVKLNLKLFSFLGNSRVDTRHQVHIEHYQKLCLEFKNKLNVSSGEPQEVLEWVERLLRGLKGAGFNRTWCAKSFYPLSDSLISQETIWNESLAKKNKIYSWEDIVSGNNFKAHFRNKRVFFARSGELLYLQLCNIFTIPSKEIETFAKKVGINEDYKEPVKLHESLQEGIEELKGKNTESLDQLIDFIEDLDPYTHENTNQDAEKLSCEWCPRESWQEGYLFAVELDHLLKAALDPVERLELCMTGCIMQVMRSLCAQSMRYLEETELKGGNFLGYTWLFTPYHCRLRQQRLASQINLRTVLSRIQKALRSDALKENFSQAQSPKTSWESLLKEADNNYGHKLFLSLGKRLGIIAPYKGPGARFVMTDALLRYLVLTLIPPGESCTYEQFLQRLYQHYGIAIEGDELTEAAVWSGLLPNSSIYPDKKEWLAEMLRAGGFLTELSDALSIVNNNFSEYGSGSKGVEK